LLVPLGLIAAPIVVIAALWVRRISPGNPFYAQEREGRGGRTFRMWKLRTMHHDADALLERHLAEHPVAAAEWAERFKLVRDPRILPGIGHLLRKSSLDELPQLWNILRGEMSFVGPRPFPEYHLNAFDERFRSLRREVLPGLTGLWQVVARADSDLALQQELDTLYIANWSVWMDVYLLARTPWTVLRGAGAY
jgi:lipopolysaccharide/colanic/teichoic acid biosynthesis glycosyltransferase